VTPVFAEEHLLVSGALGDGFFGHVWSAPSAAGGRCELVVLDRNRLGTRPEVLPNGGMKCSVGGLPPASPPSNHVLTFTFSPPHRLVAGKLLVPSFVAGDIGGSAPVARVVVRWNGGAETLSLRGRSFVGGSPAMDEKTGYVLVAYDSLGHRIARQSFG
jgi:hypothetical protein